MPDEPDPPRKFYGFKRPTFEIANPCSGTAPDAAEITAVPRPDPGIVRVHDARIDVRDLNRAAATGQPLLSATPAPIRENDVHTILRDNLAVADAAGLNDVKIDPRHRTPRQCRVRFFWFAIVAIDGPLGAYAWWMSHPLSQTTAIPFTLAIASIGYLTGRLIWHTFFLNTD